VLGSVGSPRLGTSLGLLLFLVLAHESK
jgi:hypothetical protein